jgi:hypothetical protein
MTYLGYLVAVILVVLGGGLLASGWGTLHQATVLDVKNLLLLIQVAMAFVGAIATAVLTATVGRSNEYLKAELTKSVNASTESLKADLTKSGDAFRAELNQLAPRRHAAYHAIWAAVSQYFRAVQKFENGVFDEDALKTAEKACVDASGQALLVDKADDETFHRFWQELTFLYETGEAKRGAPDDLRTLWRDEGRNLGDRYAEVREIFAARLRS